MNSVQLTTLLYKMELFRSKSLPRGASGLFMAYLAVAVICFAAVGEFFLHECESHDACCQDENPDNCSCVHCAPATVAVQQIAYISSPSYDIPRPVTLSTVTVAEQDGGRGIDHPPRG